MKGWQRGDWYDSTGLLWVNPSPNLHNLDQATMYSGLGLIESSNISVGRGTDTPFSWIGAPLDRCCPAWHCAEQAHDSRYSLCSGGVYSAIAVYLRRPGLPGRAICHHNRNVLNVPEVGIEIASMLYKLYPTQYHLKFESLLANQATLNALKNHEDPNSIADSWREGIEQYKERRKAYLMYTQINKA